MTTLWWVSVTLHGAKLAEGVVPTTEQTAGTAGEKIRKQADSLAAHLAGTAATLLGLEPARTCWLKREHGYMCYSIEPRDQSRQTHPHSWRRSETSVR